MSVVIADYPTFTNTRDHLKEVLDRAGRGRAVTVARDGQVSAVVQADRLRNYFLRTISPRVQIGTEDGRVIAIMQDRPFVSEGSTVDEALSDLLLSLREYAEDWDDHLSTAPNHATNWALVQLINLSSDETLTDWFEHGSE